MKILYHHRVRSKDGQYVHIDEMIEALRALGHEVIIVAPAASERTEFGDDGGAVTWLKKHVPRFIYELMEMNYSLFAYRRLSRAVRENRPDFIYERYNLFYLAGVWAKRRYAIPLLLEVNAPIFAERSRYDGISLKKIARWTERYIWRNADAVLPVTHVLANMVCEEGVRTDRITVIPNGINVERFNAKVNIGTVKIAYGLDSRIVLGFTGFIRDWHGLDKVIDFLAHDDASPNCHLLVVGDGPARTKLEQQAKRLGVADRVHFTGIVQRDQIASYIAAFDIALQPAVVAYASPLKLFEYLALGRAIVAPDQPNIREILHDGDNALLFDPSNERGLIEAIRRLTTDTELRSLLSGNAKDSIAKQGLTWADNARRVTTLAKQLIAGTVDD